MLYKSSQHCNETSISSESEKLLLLLDLIYSYTLLLIPYMLHIKYTHSQENYSSLLIP